MRCNMKPPSVFPTVSACRWLWESSPGVLLRVHTSLPLTPALVALATVRLPLFRSARTRLHLPRLPLHWLGFVARLLQGHLLGRPYRKGRRIDNSGFPSLWHATFLAVPRALFELVGSRQSLLSFRSLRGSSLLWTSPTPALTASSSREACVGSFPPHEGGSPVFL